MINNSCPTSTVAGYQFVSHYDCVNAGYAIAQSTFRNLQDHEEYQREIIEKFFHFNLLQIYFYNQLLIFDLDLF